VNTMGVSRNEVPASHANEDPRRIITGSNLNSDAAAPKLSCEPCWCAKKQ
jgi:hypothetical protein